MRGEELRDEQHQAIGLTLRGRGAHRALLAQQQAGDEAQADARGVFDELAPVAQVLGQHRHLVHIARYRAHAEHRRAGSDQRQRHGHTEAAWMPHVQRHAERQRNEQRGDAQVQGLQVVHHDDQAVRREQQQQRHAEGDERAADVAARRGRLRTVRRGRVGGVGKRDRRCLAQRLQFGFQPGDAFLEGLAAGGGDIQQFFFQRIDLLQQRLEQIEVARADRADQCGVADFRGAVGAVHARSLMGRWRNRGEPRRNSS